MSDSIPKFKVVIGGERVKYTATQIEPNLFKLILEKNAADKKTLLVRVKRKPCPPVKKECPPTPPKCPPTDCFPNKTKVVKGLVKVDTTKSATVQKLGTGVSWQDFKAFLMENGKLVTEDGVKKQFYSHKLGRLVGEEFTEAAHGFCEPKDIQADTVFRYSHWQQILQGISGLEKYAPAFATPPGKRFDSGMRFDEFVPALMKLIQKDHPGLSEAEAFKAALKQTAA